MTEAPDNHEGMASIEGRTITNLHFVNIIDGQAGNEQELAKVIEQLNTKHLWTLAWKSVLRKWN